MLWNAAVIATIFRKQKYKKMGSNNARTIVAQNIHQVLQTPSYLLNI